MANTVTVFLDTNIYLHYQMVDQVNWLDVLQAQSVCIVMPPTTIRELNKVKDASPQPHIRKRAGKVLKRFTELLSKSDSGVVILREGVEILFHPDEPLIDFATHHLSREVQDDQLMASIIAYREEHGGEDVRLVTADAGVLMMGKAKRQGIRTVSCPDNLKLQEQPDPEQAKIRELQTELAALKNRLPKLHLEFENSSGKAEFRVMPVADLSQDELAGVMDEVRLKYPKKTVSTPEKRAEKGGGVSLSAIMAASEFLQGDISQEDIVKYNEELDTYFEQYERFLQAHRAYEVMQARLIRLNIRLVNAGTAPAEDIDIFMHFPDGFQVLSEDEIPEPPQEPHPPSPPRTAMQKIMDGVYSPMVTYPHYLNPTISTPSPIYNVSAPYIKRTNSYDVSVNVQKMKHKLDESFDPLFILFDSYEDATSFTLTYSLLTDDLPDKVNGELHVIVRK